VNHFTEQSTQQIQPHERWASGFLVDSTDAVFSLINRGILGSGQGWAISAGMSASLTAFTSQFSLLQLLTHLYEGIGWNVKSSTIQIQSPPTGVNYCIGCIGRVVDKPGAPNNGTFIALNKIVEPPSLFTAQLAARGATAYHIANR
jgi:hypothetical protein